MRDPTLDEPNLINTKALACLCTADDAWALVQKLTEGALSGSRTDHKILAWHVDHAIRLGQL